MSLKNATLIFNALADTTRLRILSLLGEGELCVCDLMRVLKEPQSKVSRHLGYLRRSGLVDSKRGGLWMYYRLSRTGAAAVEAAKKVGAMSQPELKKDIAEFRKARNCLVACCR